MELLCCCQPGYGYPRPRALKSSLPGLTVATPRDAWMHGGSSIWTQRAKMQTTTQSIWYNRGTGICTRAGLEDDAPFAVAIAASVLSTLVLPADVPSEEGNETSVSPLGGDDVRYAAMGIISFIPLFNWLVWVFAWLDTRKQRYLIYAIVYIAPYLRSGLSLSPEDSWLPIASVLACILHVQLIWMVDVLLMYHGLLRDAVASSSSALGFLVLLGVRFWQLDISASSEGGEDLNMSKALFTATQVKQMKERADSLLLRLQQLAERPVPKPTGETKELTTAEDISRAEMEQWDEKFAKSKAEEISERVRDEDS